MDGERASQGPANEAQAPEQDDQQQQTAPTGQEPGQAAEGGSSDDEEQLGFWRRMFGGGGDKKDDGPEDEAAERARRRRREAVKKGAAARKRSRNQPRKPKKTIFDRAEEEQRKRYAQAAAARRERLAQAIGDRVEQAVVDRLDTGEQQLAHVMKPGFNEVRSLLGAIGRNLDGQNTVQERIAGVLEGLPAASQREQETLGEIAQAISGHAGETRTVAQSVQDVPQVLALARAARDEANERLVAIRDLKSEMELQRDQRERMITTLQESVTRFDERIGHLEEAVQSSATQARHDAEALRQSFETAIQTTANQARNDAESLRRTVEEVVSGQATQARNDQAALRQAISDHTHHLARVSAEEGKREEMRHGRLEQGLQDLSRRLCEGNTLATAAVARQGDAMGLLQETHEELLDALQRAQNRTVGELRRIQDEVQERTDSLAWRGRMAIAGAVGAVALLFALFYGGGSAAPASAPGSVGEATARPSPAASPEPAAEPSAAAATADGEGERTLPAGFPRTEGR